MSDTETYILIAYVFGRLMVNVIGLIRALLKRTWQESSIVTYQRWVDFYTLVVGSANIILFVGFILFGMFSALWGLLVFALLTGLVNWFFQRPVAIGVADLLEALGKISDSKHLIAHIRKTQPRVFVPVYYIRY